MNKLKIVFYLIHNFIFILLIITLIPNYAFSQIVTGHAELLNDNNDDIDEIYNRSFKYTLLTDAIQDAIQQVDTHIEGIEFQKSVFVALSSNNISMEEFYSKYFLYRCVNFKRIGSPIFKRVNKTKRWICEINGDCQKIEKSNYTVNDLWHDINKLAANSEMDIYIKEVTVKSTVKITFKAAKKDISKIKKNIKEFWRGK